jgi:hypothetical protein
LASPKIVSYSKRINSQEICTGTSFQNPDQRSKSGEEILRIRETIIPTSRQACDVQDQKSYFTFFLSKPFLLVVLENNMREINMEKIIWQIRRK